MPKNLWYYIAIALLILILILEGIGITGLRNARDKQLPTDGASTPGVIPPSQPAPDEPPEISEPSTPPAERPDLFAVQTYQVDTVAKIPSQTQALSWVETWTITSNEPTVGATEKEATVQIVSTRPDDIPTTMKAIIKKDGTVTIVEFSAQSPEGALTCQTNMPLYVPTPTTTLTATMNCSAAGQQLFTFAGNATVGPSQDVTFLGKIYKAREVVITSGGFIAGPSAEAVVPASFKATIAPGIGMLGFSGSLGDLIFGQLGAPVAQESTGKLTSSTSESIWAF